jgi:hypothetical protein
MGTSRRGRVNREGEEKGVWLMCFIYLYENRIIKLVEIVLSRNEGIEGE